MLRVDLRLIGPAHSRRTVSRFRLTVLICEAFADFLTIGCAVLGSYALYHYLSIGKHVHYRVQGLGMVAFALAAVMVLMLDRAGAYRRGTSLLRVRETEQVLRVSVQTFLAALAVSVLSSYLLSRWLLLLCLTLVPFALFIQKSLMYLAVSVLHANGFGTERVLIYGAGCTGRRVFSALTRSPRIGLFPVAFVDDDPTKAGNIVFELGYGRRRFATIIQGPISCDLLTRYEADALVVAIPSLEGERFLHAAEQAFGANVRVSFVPSHFLPSDPMVEYQDVDGVLLASFGKPLPRTGYELFKRAVDILGSFLLLTAGAPIFLLIALLVKLDSDGPVMFVQERVGESGRLFMMYKFRTMDTGALSYDFSPRASSDPRITRVGRFLRRTSLDELPQLLNVLEGTMSLVGPRPEMPFIVQKYNSRHMQRLQVKPGITGLWQLSGDRAFLIHENIEYDLYYIQHRNFFMDLAILLHTSVFAMRGI